MVQLLILLLMEMCSLFILNANLVVFLWRLISYRYSWTFDSWFDALQLSIQFLMISVIFRMILLWTASFKWSLWYQFSTQNLMPYNLNLKFWRNSAIWRFWRFLVATLAIFIIMDLDGFFSSLQIWILHTLRWKKL